MEGTAPRSAQSLLPHGWAKVVDIFPGSWSGGQPEWHPRSCRSDASTRPGWSGCRCADPQGSAQRAWPWRQTSGHLRAVEPVGWGEVLAPCHLANTLVPTRTSARWGALRERLRCIHRTHEHRDQDPACLHYCEQPGRLRDRSRGVRRWVFPPSPSPPSYDRALAGYPPSFPSPRHHP